MRFVPAKSAEQLDLQALHRIRSRMISCRTQLGNQIRGLLAEHGVAVPTQLAQLRRAIPPLLDDGEQRLSPLGKRLVCALQEELAALEERIGAIDAEVGVSFMGTSAVKGSRPSRGLGR